MLPSTFVSKPARNAEVGISQKRGEIVFATGSEHAAVGFQVRVRKETFFRFDARPFERKAVGVEAEIGEHADVLRIKMVVIASVAGWFFENAFGKVFERPEIAAGVVAFDLMPCRCATPKKFVRERFGFVGGREGGGHGRAAGVGSIHDGFAADHSEEGSGRGALQKRAPSY